MSSEEKIVRLPIAQIRLDGGTQVREKVDEAVVDEYAERMAEGDLFPPIVVIFDGTDYWLADGFHRLRAAKKREKAEIECRLFDGSQRDAVLVALKANSAHGLRRSNADKLRAVKIVLADEEWSHKTNRWIANVCGVGHHFVETVRKQVGAEPTSPVSGGLPVARLGQDGKTYLVRQSAGPRGENLDAVEEALATAERFDRCLVRVKRLGDEIERVARGPGGTYLTELLEELREHIRLMAHQLAAARPAARCHFCTGKGCDRCGQHGWLSASLQARLT